MDAQLPRLASYFFRLNFSHSSRLEEMLQVLDCYSIRDSVGQLRISSKKGVFFSSTHFTA
jgi:hypothetical protein